MIYYLLAALHFVIGLFISYEAYRKKPRDNMDRFVMWTAPFTWLPMICLAIIIIEV